MLSYPQSRRNILFRRVPLSFNGGYGATSFSLDETRRSVLHSYRADGSALNTPTLWPSKPCDGQQPASTQHTEDNITYQAYLPPPGHNGALGAGTVNGYFANRTVQLGAQLNPAVVHLRDDERQIANPTWPDSTGYDMAMEALGGSGPAPLGARRNPTVVRPRSDEWDRIGDGGPAAEVQSRREVSGSPQAETRHFARDSLMPTQGAERAEHEAIHPQGVPHSDMSDGECPNSPSLEEMLAQLDRDDQLEREKQTCAEQQSTLTGLIAHRAVPIAGARRRLQTRQRVSRAYIRVATLNMDGRTHGSATDPDLRDKWSQVNDMMRDDRIGILALQETHLSPEKLVEVQKNRPRLKILGSAHANATNTAGVALVLNRQLVEAADETPSWEIVPGRVLAARVSWHGQKLSILAVYGPNDRDGSAELWSQILDWLQAPACPITNVDILLGDMNFVEDEIDRQPMHFSRVDDAATKFCALREYCHLVDGWRRRNPGVLEFTWRRRQHSQRSRLDRIYLSNHWADSERNWQVKSAITGTDHYMVSVDLTDHQGPKVGEGRYAIPNNVIDSREFLISLKPILQRFEKENRCRLARSDADNVQLTWARAKTDIVALARRVGRKLGGIVNRRLTELNSERRELQNRSRESSDEASRSIEQVEAEIEEQRAKLSRRRGDNLRAAAWIQHDAQTKEMYRQVRLVGPKARLKSMRLPSENGIPQRWTEDSAKMSEIFRDHYDSVQARDLTVDPIEREEAIREALESAEVRGVATAADCSSLSAKTSRELVEIALRESASGTAPGIDGIPYELWKLIARLHLQTTGTPEPWPDIIGILTDVFNDVETYGVHPDSQFHRGWLCPLFKKGNTDDPANYRPITLLNSDYKILSKSLAIRLAKVAPSLIHKDQAGFMPGRSIYDQCKLARLMVSWGEAMQQNGAIVCLDQEKAYDRIRHDYLERALKAYGVPDAFVLTVKRLYSGAATTVIVNGMLSSDLLVTRKVRQGDPLSCLLFNLAIEPLASMLRTSNIHGFCLPESTRRLVVSLFADDTCVFLSDRDDPRKLRKVLATWCLASGAKFNEKKTEVVPIGTPEYRESVTTERRLYPLALRFEQSVKIAKDGEAVRLLGTYIGNRIDQQGPWRTVLDSVRASVELWKPKNLTMTGRTMVIQSIIGGKSQYLATVQGMPKSIELELTSIIGEFLWDNNGERKRAAVNSHMMSLPVHQGGKALLLPGLRNTAIQIGLWFRKLMQPAGQRPVWVEIALDLMRREISTNTATEREIARVALVNPFLQQWRPKRGSVPPDLQRLLNAVASVGYELDAPEIPQEVRLRMPFWLHYARRRGTRQNPRASANSTAATCLQMRHHILLVSDAVEALTLGFGASHSEEAECACLSCDLVRETHNCPNPTSCYNVLRATMSDIAPHWRPKLTAPVLPPASPTLTPHTLPRVVLHLPIREVSALEHTNDEPNMQIFDPLQNAHVVLPADLLPSSTTDVTRVFTRLLHVFQRRLLPASSMHLGYPPLPPPRPPSGQQVWTAISTRMISRAAVPSCGVGLVFTGHMYPAQRFRIEAPSCSNERGAISGLLLALQTVANDVPLVIALENRAVLIQFTKRLAFNVASGWLATGPLAPIYRAAAAALVHRSHGAQFLPFRMHALHSEAIAQANSARVLPPRGTNLATHASLALRGRPLATLTQGAAQRTLIASQKVPERKATTTNIGLAIQAAGDATGVCGGVNCTSAGCFSHLVPLGQ